MAAHLRRHLIRDRARRAAVRRIAAIVQAGRPGIDRGIDIHQAHARLNPAIDQIAFNRLHLIGNAHVFGNAVLFGLGFAPLDQAAVLPPLCSRTSLPRIPSAACLIRYCRAQMDRVHADLFRRRDNSSRQLWIHPSH